MTILPQTTPAPKPILIFMPPTSRAENARPQPGPAGPTPSPLPVPDQSSHGEETSQGSPVQGSSPRQEEGFPQPKLRLEIRDLHHEGARCFLAAVNAGDLMSIAVDNVLRLLYLSPSDPATHVPATRSVTVVLRDMGGVAYTTGSELDDDHKEIHFSLQYIAGIRPESRAEHEITGVLTHELVHCYQWNALGSCPGGLIEGIADWVRLNCDLSPPHWHRETNGNWDRGYQHTAYFLQYLEERFGIGTVRRINEKLRRRRYEEKGFWTELLGRPVEQLWGDYVEEVGQKDAIATNGARAQSISTVDEGTQT